MMTKTFQTLLVIIFMLISSRALAQKNTDDWAVTIYHNTLTAGTLDEVLSLSADYDSDYQLTAIALSKTWWDRDPDYSLEWELQFATHDKGQSHEEYNALMVARWYPLPWDDLIDTDLAFGLGVSYATELPPFEAANHDNAAKTLGYLLIEVELRPQGWQQWSLVLRSHHRSGLYGLFNNVHGASNSIGLGLKYRW